MPTIASSKTFCEFFAGIGLVHEALRPTGWRCVYANDIDLHKRTLYVARFPDADYYHEGDVWAIGEVVDRIAERPFLATASFPCTDMSLAGRRSGFRGPESSAFFGFAAALERLGDDRPPLVLLENVVGFLGAGGGRDFETALLRLAELGYWLDSLVLDARDFVPQSRPRLFVLGFHDQLDSPLLIKAGPNRSFWNDPWRRAVEESGRLRPDRLKQRMQQIAAPTGWATVALKPPRPRRFRLLDYLDLDKGQDWWDEHRVEKHYRMMSPRHRREVDRWLAAGGRRVATVYRRIRDGRQRAEVRMDGLAGCLRTPRGGSARQIVLLADRGDLRMRWMSPAEYARLQGAEIGEPDVPTSHALFGYGDAVCVPVVRWIDERILTPIFENALSRTAVDRD